MPSPWEAERVVMDHGLSRKKNKLGAVSGVYIPVCLNILSILMFLRFGRILGQVGLLGMLALLVTAYLVDLATALSLSAIASNGEVKGGGAYYLISRSLGPEFGGSIGILFYLAQALNTALNVVGLIDCLRLNLGSQMPDGYWPNYLLGTMALLVCTALSLAGSGIFARASNALLVILAVSILSIPFSALFMRPFQDPDSGVDFTGFSLQTLRSNLLPDATGGQFQGPGTFRELFGILFPATSGIFAGASMSGDLRSPSKAIPAGTLWAMLSTFVAYLLVVFSLAASTGRASLVLDRNVIQHTNVWEPLIFAGECATTFFSVLMGVIGSAKLLQALARDKLVPGLAIFGGGTRRADEPVVAILMTYVVAQLALFADLNQIATLISMGYQMTFFVMNLACFLLKIGSAPNFRPGFKFFTWQTAFAGSLISAAAMFFIDGTYATAAVCLLGVLFLLIHYLSPPKHWGDVSQSLIYHQVRKYLLRLKPEHIKFWRPQIILIVNNPRRHTRLIQFCNSMKKGALYILGHVIVTDDFSAGVHEAKIQQAAWTQYISEFSRIKAFVQLTMSPSITWGVRNLILSSGLGGMRPNIAVLGFYNMDELRASRAPANLPHLPASPTSMGPGPLRSAEKAPRRRRGDTSARLLEGFLPTDVIRTEETMAATSYLTILEDLAFRHRLNVAVGKGFETLETPRRDGNNSKRYIDLWPIPMSAEVTAGEGSVLTTNFDTYTLILQLGYILRTVPTWKRAYSLRVLVFVEYECEVEEERGRVRALLDKLRIEAEVVVFWLACGRLGTYETIIHGRTACDGTASAVDECLKDDEWWHDLQHLRGSPHEAKRTTQSLAAMATHHDPVSNRRRSSTVALADLQKKATVSALTRLGINMGIHTHSLPTDVLDSADDEAVIGGDSDSECSDSDNMDADFNDTGSSAGSAAGDGEQEDLEAMGRPLLAMGNRRENPGGRILDRHSGSRREAGQQRKAAGTSHTEESYGTMDQSTARNDADAEAIRTDARQPKPGKLLRDAPARSSSPRKQARKGSWPDSPTAGYDSVRPARPPLSRQASSVKFTSTLVPEAKITNEEGPGPTIMFSGPQDTRPPRRSSVGRKSSRPTPETRKADNTASGGPSVSFAETEPRSRKASVSRWDADDDAHIDLSAPASPSPLPRKEDDGSSGGSSYSTQALPLSFNDLPSRAQHLILNDMFRQNSADTAVLLTTLPIPEEGTCESEPESIGYLSGVEVLCNGLPPVLLVLSNNMTVTVSL